MKSKNKFNNKKVVTSEHTFDSKKEYRYYLQLKQRMKAINRADRVVNIGLQPRYDIIINSKKIGFYKADFKVLFADNRVEIIDVKGYKKGCAYQMFKLKKKIVEALYDIQIIEI